MQEIQSRKNPLITHIKKLATDAGYRREHGEFVCDGAKMLEDAVAVGASVTAVIYSGEQPSCPYECYRVDRQLIDFVSPLKTPQDVLFTCAFVSPSEKPHSCAIILDGIQDPGNVGTIIRTANALGVGGVILTGDCADLYNPKTVRATMGAIFRQQVYRMDYSAVAELAETADIYGAALSDDSVDIRSVSLENVHIAVGSEGRGLSAELLGICKKRVLIPMTPGAESLNAATAAGILMWEMSGRSL